MSETGAGTAAASGEYEGAKAHAKYKRCFRGPEGPYTNFAIREEAIEGRHAEAGDRLHQLPQRARADGQG